MKNLKYWHLTATLGALEGIVYGFSQSGWFILLGIGIGIVFGAIGGAIVGIIVALILRFLGVKALSTDI